MSPPDKVDSDQSPRRGVFHHGGPFWRKLAYFGATRAPEALVHYSPPAWGLAFALALPEARRRVRENLRRVLGVRSALSEQVDVARTFANFASCLTEALAVGGPTPRRVERVVRGEEHLRSALATGKGLILATAHTGGWETTGPLLASDFGLDVVIAMETELDERARAVQDAARSRSGVKVVHVGHDALAVLPLFTHLRKGGVVGIQIDRVPPSMRGIGVNLFGQPSFVPRGPFDLAAVSGAPVLPIFSHRIGYFRYEIQIGAPIRLPRRSSPDELAAGAARAAGEMEQFLRAHPTHWFHFAQGASREALPESQLGGSPGGASESPRR